MGPGKRGHDAVSLLEAVCNSKAVVITLEEGEVDAQATFAAQAKCAKITEEFARWLWSDDERRDTLVAEYNRRFNSLRAPSLRRQPSAAARALGSLHPTRLPAQRRRPDHQRTRHPARPRRRRRQDRHHADGGDGTAPPRTGPPALDSGAQPHHRAGWARSQAVVSRRQRPTRILSHHRRGTPAVHRPERGQRVGHRDRAAVGVHRDQRLHRRAHRLRRKATRRATRPAGQRDHRAQPKGHHAGHQDRTSPGGKTDGAQHQRHRTALRGIRLRLPAGRRSAHVQEQAARLQHRGAVLHDSRAAGRGPRPQTRRAASAPPRRGPGPRHPRARRRRTRRHLRHRHSDRQLPRRAMGDADLPAPRSARSRRRRRARRLGRRVHRHPHQHRSQRHRHQTAPRHPRRQIHQPARTAGTVQRLHRRRDPRPGAGRTARHCAPAPAKSSACSPTSNSSTSSPTSAGAQTISTRENPSATTSSRSATTAATPP